MIDKIIIKSLLKKAIWDKYFCVIDEKYYKINCKELFFILLTIKELRSTTHKDKDISNNDISLALSTKLVNKSEEEKEVYNAFLSEIQTAHFDEKLVETFFRSHLEQARASDVASIAIEVAEGKRPWEDLSAYVEAKTERSPFEVEFVTDDLTTLYESAVKTKGLRWRLEFLNESLGSLRQGDFGFMFARPETGKTTFLASEVTYMAEQLHQTTKRPVVWLNNEEQGSKVKLRIFQALFGVYQRELFDDIERFNGEYKERIGNSIKLYDDSILTKWRVEQILKELKPGLVVVDQIDKVYGFDGDREDVRFGKIYQWARELAKQYCPIIGICQAGATGEGKLYLGMDDVDRSKTSKQAEADFIIGIGKDHDLNEYVRGISIIKNKLPGDEDSIEEYRHGKKKVVIVPEIARYEGM